VADYDETLFDEGQVVDQTFDVHGGWLERRGYGVSVPGVEGPESVQWTIVARYRRRREAEAFLAGMRAGWRYGLELSAKRRAIHEYVAERRAAVGDRPAVDVRFHCKACDHNWYHWFEESDLDALDRQRPPDTCWVPVSVSCPSCGEPVSTELDVPTVRRRLDDLKIIGPRVADI
jgi:hypothetical protein